MANSEPTESSDQRLNKLNSVLPNLTLGKTVCSKPMREILGLEVLREVLKKFKRVSESKYNLLNQNKILVSENKVKFIDNIKL